MDKNKITIFILMLILGISIIVGISFYKSNIKEKNIEKIVDEIVSGNNDVILYLGGSKCKNCALEDGLLSILIDHYNLNFFYIDIDEITTTNKKNDVLTKLGFDVYEGVSYPSLAYYKEGKIDNQLDGVSSIKSIFNFFKKNGAISEDKTMEIDYLNYSKVNEFIEEKKSGIVAFTTYENKEDILFQEAIWSIAHSYKLDIDAYDITLASAQELNKISSNYDNVYKDDKYYASMIFIINKGKVEKVSNQLSSYDEVLAFFTENDIIKIDEEDSNEN